MKMSIISTFDSFFIILKRTQFVLYLALCSVDGQYEVKCTIFDAIYIGKTQQTFNKIMDRSFYNVKRILKTDDKTNLEKHLKSPTSCTDLG